MTVALASRVFCSISHMSAVFLRRCVKLKEFQLLHIAMLINVSSKTVDQSEDPGGGASVVSVLFTVASGMPTVIASRLKSLAFCAVFKTIPEHCVSFFRREDTFCLNGPLRCNECSSNMHISFLLILVRHPYVEQQGLI